ncbi:unnamed protein product, partial [Amoebophrya sp. A25]|eukprot:GSA25T00001087001.1
MRDCAETALLAFGIMSGSCFCIYRSLSDRLREDFEMVETVLVESYGTLTTVPRVFLYLPESVLQNRTIVHRIIAQSPEYAWHVLYPDERERELDFANDPPPPAVLVEDTRIALQMLRHSRGKAFNLIPLVLRGQRVLAETGRD